LPEQLILLHYFGLDQLAPQMPTSLLICGKNIYTAIKATLTQCTPKQLFGSRDVGQKLLFITFTPQRQSNSCHKCGNQAVFNFDVRVSPGLRGLLVRSTDERKLLGRF
jgi:hypothetical protein